MVLLVILLFVLVVIEYESAVGVHLLEEKGVIGHQWTLD